MANFEEYKNKGTNLKDLMERVPDNCELWLTSGEGKLELVLKSTELPNCFLVLQPDTVASKDLVFLLDRAIEELALDVESIKQYIEDKRLQGIAEYFPLDDELRAVRMHKTTIGTK